VVILSAPAYIIGTAIAWCIKAIVWLAYAVVLIPVRGVRYVAQREAQRPTATAYATPAYYWHPQYGWQPTAYSASTTIKAGRRYRR
jgi:hypothetical protein